MAELAETLNPLGLPKRPTGLDAGRGRKSHCGWYHGVDPVLFG